MTVEDLVAKSLKLVGRVLGDKFRLTACIGIGGSGAVYKADQIALGRTVAVKILNEELCADPRMMSRFQGEALSASRLNHPNCVSIIDYGQTPDGLLYLAMEYVKGPTLTQLLANETPLDVDRVLDIIAQSLAGIDEAHLAGVVHADLKADNIILDQRRAGVDTVKIVDFGIARLVTGVRDVVAEDRSISGTPEYMAPEVISGAPPSFASDIYAVGIILYELLVERTPFFAASTSEILTSHLKAQPKLLTAHRSNVPREVDLIMMKALAKHPSHRYATASEMREAVMAVRSLTRNLPITDSCASCGMACQPTWKFCPECGTVRAPVRKTLDAPPPAANVGAVLPLPFSGRSTELDKLLAHMRGTFQENVAMLVIGNEGSGRTNLLRKAYEKAAANNVLIYQVGPDPSGLAAPYYPMRSLLAAVLRLPSVASEQDLHDAVLAIGLNERDIPGIAQLFGHSTTLLELEPPVRRREIVWSALRAFERVGIDGSAAIVFKDIDRFDAPSLEILRRATEVEDLILPPIVLTAQTAFGTQWPGATTRLPVEALDIANLEQISRHLSDQGMAAPPADQLLEITRGQPGHLDHLVRYLIDGGKPEDTKVSLPDLIAARLSMLARTTRDVIQAAAVLGTEPQRELLRTLYGGERLEPALADAELHGLLESDPNGQLAFTSRLLRDIVYDSIPADVRRSLHAQAATAIAALVPDVALLGHHHDLAGHPHEAIDLLRRAGDLAAAQLDEYGAGQFYYRALVAVRAAVQSGDIADGADAQFVGLSVKLAGVLRARGETALARGILSEARDWSGAARPAASIDRASAAISLAEGDLDGSIAALRRGLGRAISVGDMDFVCELYIDLSNSFMRVGNIETAHRELSECIDLVTIGEGYTALDGPTQMWRVLRAQAQTVDAGGDAHGAMRLAEASLFHAQRVRARLGIARAQQQLATLCEKVGLDDKAERYRQAAISEMRGLGDRRSTAELLLIDLPSPGAVVIPNRIQDAMQLTKEIGWTEGHERAKRKSNPPPTTTTTPTTTPTITTPTTTTAGD